jgi:hypothetical protein
MTTYTLGRHVNHDDRSRAFPAPRAAVAPVAWRHYGAVLNQGQTGACTGDALTQCRVTGPHRQKVRVSQRDAFALYHEETVLQGGPVYPPADPGGSGLGVCQAAKALGIITGYSHAFGIDHARAAIQVGPMIAGSNWYQGMFQPDAAGFVQIGGTIAGGHEYLVTGYDPSSGAWSMLNSWGKGWGLGGVFHMTDSTFARLLNEQGDVTLPTLA